MVPELQTTFFFRQSAFHRKILPITTSDVCKLYDIVLIIILTNLFFDACCKKTSNHLTIEKRELLPSAPLLNLSSPCGFIPLLCLLAPTALGLDCA